MAVANLKGWIRRGIEALGYEVRKVTTVPDQIPDRRFYAPLWSPWIRGGYGELATLLPLATRWSLVSPERCYVLATLAEQALALDGEFWEAGVYRGGTASLLAELLSRRGAAATLFRLFDTFAGMPQVSDSADLHVAGEFADTSVAAVRDRTGNRPFVRFHQGVVPETFVGLEGARIAFAHIDVDLHKSVHDCCAFIYPRLVPGGIMIFDDYGFPSCPGARKAVDTYFHDKPERPLVLPTGQAVVFGLGRASGRAKLHSVTEREDDRLDNIGGVQ